MISQIPEYILRLRLVKDNGCWEWLGGRTSSGYGQVTIAGKQIYIHRYIASLVLNLDIKDSNVLVLHRCDNPPCFNPEHLFTGDEKKNFEDAKPKNRVFNKFLKKDFCFKGHSLTEDNIITRSSGTRRCKTCYYGRSKSHYRKVRRRLEQKTK